MAWIAVHEEVLGGKLRGFRKDIKCSEAEALGILTLLWLWARKNADMSGMILNADKSDIAAAISPSISKNLKSYEVAEALIKNGFVDEKNGNYYIHDWYEHQQYWYLYLDKKDRDRMRKRLERERNKAEVEAEAEAEAEKKNKNKKDKPKKKEFAQSVKMTEIEYETLVKNYGETFTKKCIEKLDNYKVSKGKSYKDDYRAILSWVVKACDEEFPGLRAKNADSSADGGNPFAQYRE